MTNTTNINLQTDRERKLQNKDLHVQPKYNRETELAIQEANDIASGKIKAKTYKNFAEMLADIEAISQ